MGDYLKLYQNCDVILLAEVFQEFRRKSLENFELDPVHFITSAQLTFNAGLKMTKVELKLLHNVNDYPWFEKQIRGGICFLTKRYVRANNPLIPALYDSSKPCNYILPLDVVNLYGSVMLSCLPEGNFSWLSKDEISKFNVFNYGMESNVGYFVECDLEYPVEIHDYTNSFPLAPDHLVINYEMLSSYSQKLCDDFNLKQTLPTRKLTPNFFPKRNYVVHYLNLKFYLSMGIKLIKIHRVMAFTQSRWLQPYIGNLHQKRVSAKDTFSKSFFKKMINSFFGRLMLNVRKRTKIVGALDSKTCEKYLNNPLLESFHSVNDDFVLFKMHMPNLILDKPIYAGFCILELSKLKMYELYYNNFKKHYREKCQLLYIDTDSLYLNIYTQGNVYSELKEKFEEILDLSNFNSHHEAYSEVKKTN